MPRAPLHSVGVTFAVRISWIPSESITPPSSLIRAHAPLQIPPRPLRHPPYRAGSLQVVVVPAGRWTFPTLSLRIFPWMLGSVPRRLTWCIYPLLPTRHRPSPPRAGGSAPQCIRLKQLRAVCGCGAVTIRSPLQASRFARHPDCPHTRGSSSVVRRWLLHPSTTRVVAFTCIGYASRPIRVIDDTRTSTSLDSQPCRLLPRARTRARARFLTQCRWERLSFCDRSRCR